MGSSRDRRSEEAAQYRKLYGTPRWKALRKAQLTSHPLCQRCKAKGRIRPATICHHIDKDSKATDFFRGPFMSVCQPCHDGDLQSEERLGFSREIGADGWPTDERHPTNVQG